MVKTEFIENPFFYKTHAFKDQVIHVYFSYPKKEPEVTLSNLLSYMMVDRTEKFMSKQSMNAEMDRLFGLSISAKTAAYGETHSFEFKLKTLSSHFLDAKLQDDVLHFLKECIYHPLLTEASFTEAKINMSAALLRLQDQANIQGFRLAIDAVGEHEAIKTYSQGSVEVLNQVKLKDLIGFHQMLLQQNPQIFYSNTKSLDLSLIYNKDLKSPDISNAYLFPVKKYQYLEQERSLPQSTLTLLFSTQIKFMEDNYLSLRLLTMMLGQLPDSLLFQEVREKHSLCYSIHAQLLNFDGLMGIQTGIDFKQKDKTKDLILFQIDRLKRGKFSQSLLNVAKKMYKSNLQTIKEDRNAYFNLHLQMNYVHKKSNVDEMIESILKITKDDIQSVAAKLCLISESLIKGVDHE